LEAVDMNRRTVIDLAEMTVTGQLEPAFRRRETE
jgi:hypothetical protein